MLLGSAILALSFWASPVLAQTAGGDGCALIGPNAAPSRATSSAACAGGPLKPGDPRLGSAPVPRTADRAQASGHSFQVGGSTVRISGSVRVEGTYSR